MSENNKLIRKENVNDMILNPEVMGSVMQFCQAAALNKFLPEHLSKSDNPAATILGVVMQANQWGLNPMAVMNSTYEIRGKLGYEAKLVEAALYNSDILKGRLRVKHIGEWQNYNGSVPSERGLGVTISGRIADDAEEPCEHTLYFTECKTRNSPLWKSNPKLQIIYTAKMQWMRIYTPDIVFGAYTREDLMDSEVPTYDAGSGSSESATSMENCYTQEVLDPEPEPEPEEKQPEQTVTEPAQPNEAQLQMAVDNLINWFDAPDAPGHGLVLAYFKDAADKGKYPDIAGDLKNIPIAKIQGMTGNDMWKQSFDKWLETQG
jgi:hypothetical protein